MGIYRGEFAMNLKEFILGLLCSVFTCLFLIGMLPWHFISMFIGIAIAIAGLRYVLKNPPAWWFIGGFIIGCLFFTFAF